MNDGIAALSSLTGLSRTDLTGIWAQVKANHALLDGCQRHDFEPAVPGGRKRRCQACGGEAGVIEASWYEKGLLHAAIKP